MSDYEQQQNDALKIYDELKNMGCPQQTLDNIDKFLDDIISMNRIKMPQSYTDGERFGVIWSDAPSETNVLFSTDTNNWEWWATIVTKYYTSTYHGGGEPSRLKNNPEVYWYFMPEVAYKWSLLPETFNIQPSCMFNKHQYHIVWETNRYDGMLSGFCSITGKLYAFNCVEETDFTRKRLYAVYKIPLHSRVLTWYKYHTWNLKLAIPVLWNISRWWHRKTHKYRNHSPETYSDSDIIGYFSG